MPSFNALAPRTGMWGNQLEVYRHHSQKQQTNRRSWDRTAEVMGDLGSAAGTAIGFAGAYGARRFGQWYYPSAKTAVYSRRRGLPPRQKKKKYKRVCCRRIRGRKECSPEFCHKKRKLKYFY